MKKAFIIGVLALSGVAHAQSSSTASQTSQSQSVAQGTIQFSQSPADTTSTVRNVSAPVLGAYAASFNQLNCGQTAQGGVAFAGFSLAGGGSKDSASCVLETAAAETARQSTITASEEKKEKLQDAAIAIRCQVDRKVWLAYKAAGLDCKGLKPDNLERADTQPESTRVSSN